MSIRGALTDRFNNQGPAVAAAAGDRLQRIAAQWTPAPAATHPGGQGPETTAPQGAHLPADALANAIGQQVAPTARVFHLDRRAWRGLLVIVLGAALITSWLWWQGRPRAVALAPMVVTSGAPVPGVDAGLGAAAGQVVVHVIGAVNNPGLVQLPAGSRVDDAIEAVGGAKTAKALASVNLARILIDGEQIVVGSAPGAVTGSPVDANGVLNLNSATETDFEALPGVGPVLAARILAWRTTNGTFSSIDELGEVSGIGPSILENLRSLVRV